jgi:hypothetical protein
MIATSWARTIGPWYANKPRLILANIFPYSGRLNSRMGKIKDYRKGGKI